jgi:transposase
MKAYSLDLRQKILRACDQRLGSQRTIAAFFGVSQSFIEKLMRRRRMTGDIKPRPHAGGREGLCDEVALAVVRQLVQEQSDATLQELCAHLYTQRGLRVSVPTVSRLVTQLRLPRKKSHSTPASGRLRVSSKRAPATASGSQRSTSGA